MRPAIKLVAFAGALVLLAGLAFVAGRVLLPQPTSAAPAAPAPEPSATGHGHEDGTPPDDHGSNGDQGAEQPSGENGSSEHSGHGAKATVGGLSLESNGYRLSRPQGPTAIGRDGRLSFMIMDEADRAVTQFDLTHEKRLHLIVVRTDGTRFRHVHPTMAADGTWSLPWRWPVAGGYRIIADFVPSDTGTPTTLSYGVEIAGSAPPTPKRAISRTATVDGFDVTISGDLDPDRASALTVSVHRGDREVVGLQPYLGAYGHLVILREGDLGYLHVHPEGAEPAPGSTAGPDVVFAAQAPSRSRYLLYFDFQVDGVVRTAEFVLGSDSHDEHAGSDQSPNDHEDDHGGDDHAEDDHGHEEGGTR